MQIVVGGGPYEIHNTATKQVTRLEVHDLFLYKAATIVYGSKMRGGLWVPSAFGRRESSEGPACFPLFLNEQHTDVTRLVNLLRSLPLWLVLPDDSGLPVLSVEDSYKVLGGQRGVRNDMIQRAQQMVDLYSEWKATKVLPEWFRLKRDLAKSVN